MYVTRFISILLLPLIAAPQQPRASESSISVRVLEGDGAFNNIQKRVGRNIRVQVRNAAGDPLEGATVTFAAPAVGPGVSFGSSGNTYEIKTDTQGEAVTAASTPNGFEGRFVVRVTAGKEGQTATARVVQSNTSAGGIAANEGSGKRKLWLLVGVVGGAAVGGTALALRRGGSSTPSAPALSLSVGPVTVGGPR